ncbi:MAG: glycosyltransferase family 9 protein [Methylacidiphilales bacterium]|nr:glycosyltransferase family 9 protein [Candidatus Methylacidiphilales bacterium]
MRILAIQLNQPGDAILTTPALRWLMDQGHEVHVLLQPLGAELLQTMPGLASVDSLPRGSIQLSRDIRRAIRYRRAGLDWAVVFSKCSDRPALWALLSGAKKRTGLRTVHNAHLGRIGFINDWQVNSIRYVHTSEHHLYLAGAPDDVAGRQKLEYRPPEPERAWAADWMRRRGLAAGGYLLLHATSRWPSKYWPMANLARFIRSARPTLNLPVLVTSGRDAFEAGFTRELIAQAQPDYHELGTLTVSQLGALLENAAGFVGVDSMPMHLAAALGKPGIALFGPTEEKIWGPWHSRLCVLRTDCRCLRESTRSCPKGPESRCLANISSETVLDKLAHLLKNSA